jgi:hypothetical protein
VLNLKLILFPLGLALWFASAAAYATTAPTAELTPKAVIKEPVRAVEMTYIQAKPGKREQMKRYLIENWFVLDEAAVKQGLMHSYRLLDTGEDAKPDTKSDVKAWNIIVISSYRDEKGYEAIKSEFETIRKSHRKVLIDGLDFRDLGQVVNSHQLWEPQRLNAK